MTFKKFLLASVVGIGLLVGCNSSGFAATGLQSGTFTNNPTGQPPGGGVVSDIAANPAGAQAAILNLNTYFNASAAKPFVFGVGAGGSLPANAQIEFFEGLGAGESASGVAYERLFIGAGAGINNTTGGASVAVGVSTCAGTTTQSGDICVGSDAGRDYGGYGTDIAFGTGALADGNGNNPNFAFGANTIWGAASTITLSSGAPHAGDVYSVTLSTNNACNGTSVTVNCTYGAPITATYTVLAGDTTGTILANNLASSLSTQFNSIGYTLGDGVDEKTRNLFVAQFQIADATNWPLVLKGHYPWSWKLTPSGGTCTGTCAVTLTIGPGFTGGNNIAVGNYLLNSPVATTLHDNILIMFGGPSNFATTLSNNIGFGNNSGTAMNGATYNVWAGFSALNSCVNCSQNVVVANYGGYNTLTGNANTILGDETTAGSTCVSSGNQNLEVGQGACVNSPTANGQMSIENAIYGSSNTGVGAALSTGCIGFYTKGCTGNVVQFAVPILLPSYTIAALPTPQTGMTAYVTNATACVFGTTPTAGGVVNCKVFYNGTSWVGG